MSDWQDGALCAQTDPDLFFHDTPTYNERAARRVCGACPVVLECLRAGLGEEHGVWGGLTPLDRRNLRRRAG